MIAVITKTHRHTLRLPAPWSFVVMPCHGLESTLEGKDCVHDYNVNSTFNVRSDSKNNILILTNEILGLFTEYSFTSQILTPDLMYFFTAGFYHCDPGDANS